MTGRRTVPARRKWGSVVGYSRAIRVGDVIEVSGTSATREDGSVEAPGDAYLQTQSILRTIVDSLAELDASVGDVIRTRVYLTDIGQWADAARAHQEVFGATMPACTFVEIAGLMLPGLVVEVEASAIAHSSRPQSSG